MTDIEEIELELATACSFCRGRGRSTVLKNAWCSKCGGAGLQRDADAAVNGYVERIWNPTTKILSKP